MNKLRMWVLALAICLMPGCAAFQKVVSSLPTVIQYVQDAAFILDSIDRAVLPILSLQKDDQLTRKYANVMDVTRQSLQVALRSAEGGKQLSEDEIDAAFANFRKSYTQLLSLLQTANLMSTSGTMAAAPGAYQITVETPLAVSRTGN